MCMDILNRINEVQLDFMSNFTSSIQDDPVE